MPVPVYTAFDYILQEPIEHELPGYRVLVPFGKGTTCSNMVGVVLEQLPLHQAACPLEKIKPIASILEPIKLFDTATMELLNFAATYYHHPIGEVYATAMPLYLRKLDASIKKLSNKLDKQHVGSNNAQDHLKQDHLSLNHEQQLATEKIIACLNQFACFLLDGVTGSGKTEVYLQVIAEVIKHNKQAMVLVPEISLTPQTVTRFQDRFNCNIAVIHSKMTPKQRIESWIQAQSGMAKIIIGTRSALFVPLQAPGVLIIDEEHDASFKQQEGFKYHARDLLIKKAQINSCPIILGSATTSIESMYHAKTNKYHHLTLKNKVSNSTTLFEIIDIRHKQLLGGLSYKLLDLIKTNLEHKRQILVFLNRRGYAPITICFNCSWTAACKNCDAKLFMHLQENILICHHCMHQIKIPRNCPQCSQDIKSIGFGTEKLENILAEKFPLAVVKRVDKDSTKKKNSLEFLLDEMHTGKIDILIGTQMLTKGHDFSNIGLVAIIDIDSAFYSSDFRATERLGQLITQVAGRTGRRDARGHVVIQTVFPTHDLLNLLIKNQYTVFQQAILKEREFYALPPFTYQCLISCKSKKQTASLEFLTKLKNLLHTNALPYIKAKLLAILGPTRAPKEKLHGKFGVQLLLQSPKRQVLHHAIKQIREIKSPYNVQCSIDIDPIDFY